MSFQPGGQVARLTPLELVDLDGWNFIKSYNKYHDELVDLAKSAFSGCCIASNSPPTEAQFHRAYVGSLLCADLYLVKIAQNKKHLRLSLYPHYAELLSKYVREHDEAEIINVPCPPP